MSQQNIDTDQMINRLRGRTGGLTKDNNRLRKENEALRNERDRLRDDRTRVDAWIRERIADTTYAEIAEEQREKIG